MILNDKDMDFLVECVATAALTEIVPRFRTLSGTDIQEKKSAIDLVTEADLRTEAWLGTRFLERFPHALIVGEEACGENPGLIDALPDADLAFVIDPVDGTFNFAAGNPLFGSMLSVVIRGETVAGIIHDPLNGDTLLAVRGGGARIIRKSGETAPIRVAEPRALSEMVGTISIHDLPYDERRRLAGNLAKTRMTFGYNCSAFEYWMLSTGKVHFIGHHSLKPWDHLAGILIHAEAGGYSAKFDGSPYLPGQLSGGILSASSKDVWIEILNAVILAET